MPKKQCAAEQRQVVNEPSDFYGTPLYAAAYGGHCVIVAELLSLGVNIESVGQHGMVGTPLFTACSRGHVDVVKLLLAHGAKVWVSGAKFKSAMDVARAFKQTEVLRILESNSNTQGMGETH